MTQGREKATIYVVFGTKSWLFMPDLIYWLYNMSDFQSDLCSCHQVTLLLFSVERPSTHGELQCIWNASYLHLHLEIDNGGRIKTKLYEKCDAMISLFPIVNFPFISSNIPASQLIRYSRACAQYSHFLDRVRLSKQGYDDRRLKLSQLKLYGRHQNMVDRYEIATSQITTDILLFT